MQNSIFQIGTSGWSYDAWRGLFYPKEIKKNKWLEYYATQFPTLEINATFYRWFKDSVYQGWYDRAPEHFIYNLKIPRLISHSANLTDNTAKVIEFYQSAQILKQKLGFLLLQLPPRFPYDLARLRKFIMDFPEPSKLVIEFRNKQWFTLEAKAMLSELQVITCAADSPKTTLVDWLTADTAYIRLHGRTQWFEYCYSEAELKEVAQLAKHLNHAGAKQVYIFFNNTVTDYAIKNARTLQTYLS